ncbi:hypothetical protein D3C76_627180 [compost metagenome]
MVAVPAVLVVQREQEQIGAQQLVDHRLAVVASGQRIAQRHGEAVEHAGLQEELAALVALPGQHVFGQVFGQLQMGAGEGGDELALLAAALQRQSRQVQGGDPAFGTLLQRLDLAIGERQVVLVVNERLGFLHAEAQGVGIDFQQPAMRAQTAQPEVRCIARGYGQKPAGGQGVQQLADEVQGLGAVHPLELVEEDGEGLLALADLFEQDRRPCHRCRTFDTHAAGQV